MDSGSWILYSLLLVLILGGGYFAAAETAFASANRIRLKNQAENGSDRAKTAVYITEHFEEALSSVLVGNNIMHISTASLATLLAKRLWGSGAVAWSTIVITIVVFFVSEMLPKTLAGSHSERVCLALAPSLRMLMRVLFPISFFFSRVSEGLTHILGANSEPTVTEEELQDLIEGMGADDAAGAAQNRLLRSAMAFDHKTAAQVMTPYAKAEVLDSACTPEQILAFCKQSRHSRAPVIGAGGGIVGILFLRDYIKAWMDSGSDALLRPLVRKPLFVPPEVPIDDLLRTMSRRKIQLAIVAKDAAYPLGIVTAEDILEELVGDFGEAEVC